LQHTELGRLYGRQKTDQPQSHGGTEQGSKKKEGWLVPNTWLTIISTSSPVVFVSVASKGLSQDVSLLFATLTGGAISVAAKGLKEEEGRR
jgi:hypothetical protein